MTGRGLRVRWVLAITAALYPALAGCATLKRGELYSVHESIRIGEPFPDQVRFPEGAKCTERPGVRAAECSDEWKFGRFVEHAVYLVNADGVVTAKRYTLACAEAYLLFLWQYERCVSEWEVLAEPTATINDLGATCTALSTEHAGVPLSADADDSAALLEAAEEQGDIKSESFEFARVVANSRPFPSNFLLIGNPTWQVRRVGDRVLRIRIEDRQDCCPLIATPVMWLIFPFQQF